MSWYRKAVFDIRRRVRRFTAAERRVTIVKTHYTNAESVSQKRFDIRTKQRDFAFSNSRKLAQLCTKKPPVGETFDRPQT